MDHHAGVLQLRVEPAAVGRRERQPLERIGPENSMTATKKTTTEEVTPATYGISARVARGVSACASAPKSESTTAQNRSDPFCPAQNAEKM